MGQYGDTEVKLRRQHHLATVTNPDHVNASVEQSEQSSQGEIREVRTQDLVPAEVGFDAVGKLWVVIHDAVEVRL